MCISADQSRRVGCTALNSSSSCSWCPCVSGGVGDSMRYPDWVRFAVSVKEVVPFEQHFRKTSPLFSLYTSWYPEPDVCSYSIVYWDVQSTTTGRSRPQQRSSKKSMRFLKQP